MSSWPFKIFVIAFFIVFMSCAKHRYVEYKPHYVTSNGNTKYYKASGLDSTEFANTIHVLEFYGMKYKTENGNVILITRQVAKDWNLVWNFTTKANDKDWLKSHRK